MRGNHVYELVSGPSHRIDVSFDAKDQAAARDLPHGIVGQSFSSPLPRIGKKDRYPWSGTFTTAAMAEGAIDGEAALYEVASAYSTAFAFSRFEAYPWSNSPEGAVWGGSADLGAAASTVEV